MEVSMKLLYTLQITILILGLTGIKSFASFKAPQTKVSVASALQTAASVLRGKQLDEAKKQINERSIGGTTIAYDEVNRIIENILSQAHATSSSSSAGSSTASSASDLELNDMNAILASLGLGQSNKKSKTEATPSAATNSQKKTAEHKKQVETDPLVPSALRGKVTYIRTQQQGTNECGFRAVFFAKIISELPTDKINTQNINSKMELFRKKICQRFIEDPELIALANKEKIENLYAIYYHKKDKTFGSLQRTVKSPSSLDEMIARLHDTGERRAYFVLNINNSHWVLMAVIKPARENPKIFYLDSLNNPIRPGTSIYDQLIAFTQALGL